MYRKLPQSGGGNTLKKEMVMMTIGDHIETKDPLIEWDTLMKVEDPLIEEDTLVKDPLMEEEDPLDLPEGNDHQVLKDHLGL